jgi:AraC-like DNA-binding protein
MNLQYHMILEYTQKVERIRLGKRPGKLVIDVANYIQHHLSEPITAEEIAKELYLSRPYLSRKFIEETGESLTDFILKEKTEEAKRLLRYSDKTLTAISNYLGFSSQSHFSRVFKKYTQRTPGEYREKYTG